MSGSLPSVRGSLVHLLNSTASDGLLRRELFARLAPIGVMGSSDWLRPSMPGLDSIEREVLSVHRNEIGHLLLVAAAETAWLSAPHPWLLAPEDPECRGARICGGSELHADAEATQEAKAGVAEEWNTQRADAGQLRIRTRLLDQRLGRWPELNSGQHSATPALNLLQRCFSPSTGGWPTAVELYSASMRLEPRRDARIGLGLSLGLEGKYGNARGLLNSALQGYPRALHKSLALQNLGAVLRWAGDCEASLIACRAAVDAPIERAQVFVNWLDRTCLVGRYGEALDAANALDACVTMNHPAVLRSAMVLKRRRIEEGLPASRLSTRRVRDLAEVIGPNSRKIVLAAFADE
ncbi:MAG: hypothetical protein ACI835_002663 [Planctomycetota bacterium]|jgi:hypothetical protein